MKHAAVTFVYNENINLPIWIAYYGRLFGEENLFVIDHSSSDGSTDALGRVNVIRIPRTEFDEEAKTNQISCMHSLLTSSYDIVVATDCDEILVADPTEYSDLNHYIARLNADYVNGVGIDIVHVINEEPPLNLDYPILKQRRFGRFQAPECKQLISRIPMRWLPGLHSSNKPPNFDSGLYIFHLKLMDYNLALNRHKLNNLTTWSAVSLSKKYGAHHRYPLKQFVHQNFLVPIDLLSKNGSREFEFSSEIVQMNEETVSDAFGYYHLPMNLSRMVEIPDKFSSLF